MKKILVIITTDMVPYGGLTTVAMNYYRFLDKTKFQMDFASTNDICDELKKELNDRGSNYYNLGPRNFKRIADYFLKLRRISKRYNAVHIHANSATATVELLAAKMADVPQRIIHIHNTQCSHVIFHKILKPIFDVLYTDAIACSDAAGKWIFTQGKYTVLNNAIDVERYKYNRESRKEIRTMYGLGDEFVIGNVAKMSEQKNHSFLLKVFGEIIKKEPLAKLMLVGDGKLRNSLEKMADEIHIKENVIFCGMQNDSSKYYSAFDVVLFPSLWEGLPLSLIEAQANGLTCIASDQITSEVNMGGVVQISLADSPDLWCRHILEDIQQDRNRKSIELCERIQSKGFDVRKNQEKLEEIYLH